MYEERTVSKNIALLDAQISSKGLLFTPRHSQNRHFVALRCFAAHFCVCKTQCSYSWRSRPTFMQADFHARQKIAHKNVRVNCNSKDVKSRNIVGDRYLYRSRKTA